MCRQAEIMYLNSKITYASFSKHVNKQQNGLKPDKTRINRDKHNENAIYFAKEKKQMPLCRQRSLKL